jgi:hypothetical protein
VTDYARMTKGELEDQIALYEHSVFEYKAAQLRGMYYFNGNFYQTALAVAHACKEQGAKYRPRKYDATEDLAFLYTELGKCFQEKFRRQQEKEVPSVYGDRRGWS